MLDDAGKTIFLRCPLIPGLNDSDELLSGIAELANSLKHAEEITVEPYHPLGMNKFARLGEKPTFERNEFASEENIKNWIAKISAKTNIRVIKG